MIKCNFGGCAVAVLKIHSDRFKGVKINWVIIFSGEKKTTFQVKVFQQIAVMILQTSQGKGDRPTPVCKVSTSKPSFDTTGISSLINAEQGLLWKKNNNNKTNDTDAIANQ